MSAGVAKHAVLRRLSVFLKGAFLVKLRSGLVPGPQESQSKSAARFRSALVVLQNSVCYFHYLWAVTMKRNSSIELDFRSILRV